MNTLHVICYAKRALTLATTVASLSASMAHAADGQDCASSQDLVGKTVVSRFFTVSRGCIVQVTPLNKPNLVYREYVFDERGAFTVFSSTEGPYETATGTREFFLFPRVKSPRYTLSASGDVMVTLNSGPQLKISGGGTRVIDSVGIKISEDPRVGLDNRSGLEILTYPGLILDTGWQVGGAAASNPKNESRFRDGRGTSCAVKNDEIFAPNGGMYNVPLVKFATDAKLAAFLRQRCPQLDVDMLLN